MDEQLKKDLARFANLTYEDFQKLAADPSLSIYQRIGFPNEYRKGFEKPIFEDLKTKLPNLHKANATIFDIGCGCSELPRMLMGHCLDHGQALTFVDSKEMLDNLPNDQRVKKIAGRYPYLPELQKEMQGKVDVVILYSVFHYVFAQGEMVPFLDSAARLLSPGGQLLIGDIPNVSKRRRFFASETGVRFHQNFTGSHDIPDIAPFTLEDGKIDDAVITSILSRYRASGFETYILPQNRNLPMENRREDILIVRH